MLDIIIPATESYDEVNNEFINTKEQRIKLEHSLVSLHKWEMKWQKPFLSNEPKTTAETIDYIKCMTITQNVPDMTYRCLTMENIDRVNRYIESPMTATTFSQMNKGHKREIITAEIIYYWMIGFNIPMECQKWHLNSLLTLIRVCDEKSQKQKPMSKSAIMRQNAAINAARRKKYNTKG